MNDPRLYYIYRYKNGCSFDVYVNLKLNNAWDDSVGKMQRGQDVTVSVMYDAASGNEPTAIMLCKSSSGPKGDLFCKP